MKSKEGPVIVGLSGGLGNQMFQYAAGRALSVRLGCSLLLDLSWFFGAHQRQFALSPFNIIAEQRLAWPMLPQSAQREISRFSRRFAPRIMGVPVFRESRFHYMPSFSSLKSSVFLEGYWQSQRYFSEIRPQLLEEFSLNQLMPSASIAVLDAIQTSDAICVHVRRGDYVSNPAAAKVHGICSRDYYQKAVAELINDLQNPHCFIFSDEPAAVMEAFSFDCPVTVVDINGPTEVHFDLSLMAACKHFVIANSSLSWWGAWLGAHNEKRVIAPEKWFLTEQKNTKDLLPDNWLRI